jgi:hypothetical protein
MPDWLKDLIRDVVREILHAELVKHGVVSPDPSPPPK